MNGYIYIINHPDYCELGIATEINEDFNFECVYEIQIQQINIAQHILQKEFTEFNIQYDAWTPYYNKTIYGLIEPLLERYGIQYRKCCLVVDDDINFLTESIQSMKIESPTDNENAMVVIENADNENAREDVNADKSKVMTEDLGKIFEKAICLLYEIEYDGKYKYSVNEAEIIKQKIHKLKEVFPYQLKHVAKNGNKYDFVVVGEEGVLQLSAKTTKKDGKVCPQVIGQPSKQKFCKYFDIEDAYNSEQKYYDLEKIKHYIQENVNKMLHIYAANTFDCPIVYYNKHTNKILFIRRKTDIDWTNYLITFSHLIKNKAWNESSSIIIGNTTIGEFQIHNHRDCIKFRWAFEKLLNLFKHCFDIIDLSV